LCSMAFQAGLLASCDAPLSLLHGICNLNI
jgi:hypothetical protein